MHSAPKHSFVSLALALLLLAASAAARGFAESCNATALGNLRGAWASMLIANCYDETGDPHASFLSMNDCLANKEGVLSPKRSGNALRSCTACTLEDKRTLQCQCDHSNRDSTPASLDIDSFLKINDGIIECFEFKGVELPSMRFEPR